MVNEAPKPSTIEVNNTSFSLHDLSVTSKRQLVFDFHEPFHAVVFDTSANATKPANINDGGGDRDPIPVGQKRTTTFSGNPGGQIPYYYCEMHRHPILILMRLFHVVYLYLAEVLKIKD
jgi:hypothetical protein